MIERALVTGGSRRVGRAIAEGLAKEGWAVAVHWRSNESEAADAAASCLRLGAPKVAAVHADLAIPADRQSLVDRAAEALGGPLTLLVNNASRFAPDGYRAGETDEADRNLAVGLIAPFALVRAFAQRLPSDGAASVVNILDADLSRPAAGFASYRLAKAGLAAMTEDAALALAPGIRVNAIAPGPVLPAVRERRAHFERSRLQAPLRRHATLEEILSSLFHILRCPSMTGATLPLDGGRRLGLRETSG